MVELTAASLGMAAQDVRGDMRTQLLSLQDLLIYLEDRGQLGAKEFLYCQSKLQEVIKELRRLERTAAKWHESA